MLATLVTVFGEMLGMFGDVVAGLFTAAGEGTAAGVLYPLLPYFLVGIAASIILLGAKVIRKFVWGN